MSDLAAVMDALLVRVRLPAGQLAPLALDLAVGFEAPGLLDLALP
jgi:hypothetical protein